jgi:alkanesulfonate monooxygenase SsuD/methylene tetrahydromethanopterin reductase-like flavin-dependent oxidoreductase (luciferase family)
MKYGVVMRTDIDLDLIAELACDAEKHSWDGFFVWNGFLGPNPWILLASVATRTEQIRFGVMLTAATVGRPWQLASETATLDRLSKGRLILSLGLGAAGDLGFDRVGEEMDRKLRAALLDETIDLLKGLWTGQPFSYEGKNYR